MKVLSKEDHTALLVFDEPRCVTGRTYQIVGQLLYLARLWIQKPNTVSNATCETISADHPQLYLSGSES